MDVCTVGLEPAIPRLRLIRGSHVRAPPWTVAEWFGVDAARMAEVLPNAANFPIETMFRASATDGRPSITI